MSILIVVSDPRDWPLEIAGVTVVPARAYLTERAYAEERSWKVFNLCSSYRYESLGYYVSLLAEARGHRPLPRVTTIEDLQSQTLVRVLTEDLDELVQRALAHIRSDAFELSVYFGRNVSAQYDSLSRQLFNLLQAPLMRASFEQQAGQWRIRSVRAIGASDIPAHHREFALEAAARHFASRRPMRRRSAPRFDIALLIDPANPEPPSNPKAMHKFQKAAESLGLRPELVTRSDFGRLTEFDAMFIRDTTYANHYTYRFARRAAAEGLALVDDPDSILKCNNKVYIAELLSRHGVASPKTLPVHRDNVDQIIPALALPCVLKQPGSSFSRGVVKIESERELLDQTARLLATSELIIAQEWLPTTFDWRVGILDRRVLFVAKYLFPSGHWQIIKRDGDQKKICEGPTVAISVGETPEEVVKLALRAANLIGDGFYGVDLKQVENRCYVIEVNDNPNVDAGGEDGVLKDALYREVMGVFLKRIEERKKVAR